MYRNKIIEYNVLNTPWPLEDNSVDCCITSPPYWGLRDYGTGGQLGLERTPKEFVANMVLVFEEVRRVLKPAGTLWLNLGDSYAHSGAAYHDGKSTLIGRKQGKEMGQAKRFAKSGSGLKPKDLVGIPWMLAFALRSAGWYLRQDIIWSKPNPMPESVNDRCTKSHEYLFLLTKSRQYYYDQGAILEPIAAASAQRLNQDIEKQNGSDRGHGGKKHNGPMKACHPKGNRKTFRGGGKYTGSQSFDNTALVENNSKGNATNETGMRNKRSVWTVATQPFSAAHFATFPEELILPCVLAGCPPFTCDCDNCKKHYYSFNEQETKNKDLSGLQAKISSNRPMEPGENFLHEEVQHKMGGEEQAIHQRVDDYNQGIQDDFDSASSQRKQGWVCNGAQVENGKEIGETPKENGGCSPSKSQQTGQSNLQFAGVNQEPTRQIEKAADSANSLPALWQENQSVGTCPACGGNLILKKGVILDCFMGAGTTALVAMSHGRGFTGFELNPEYIEIANNRLKSKFGMFYNP